MKIAWIVPGFQSDANDSCIPALTDLAHYVAAQHDLTVYALQYPNRRDCYRVGRVQVHSFGVAAGRKFQKLKRLLALLGAVMALRRQSSAVVHAFWAAEPALIGVLATKGKRSQLVVSCMGGEAVYLPEIGYGAANKFLDKLYVRSAIAGADRLACGSEVLAQILVANYNLKSKPQVLPLGVDLARFNVCGNIVRKLPEQPLILAVGSLLPVKNHASLIEAMTQLPEVRLRIVGAGPERCRLEKIIEEYALQARIELTGLIPPEKMPAAYAQADLLALPSYYESQCVALLEGMACGLPVVATKVGLAPTLAASGALELANDTTPKALVQALSKLLAKSANWPELRQKARIEAEHYSLAQCGQAFLKFYTNEF